MATEARRRDNRDRPKVHFSSHPAQASSPVRPALGTMRPLLGYSSSSYGTFAAPKGTGYLTSHFPARKSGIPVLPAAYLCREIGLDLVPTGANTPREVDVPLPPTATPRHPPIEAPVAKFYDEPLPDLDREAA